MNRKIITAAVVIALTLVILLTSCGSGGGDVYDQSAPMDDVVQQEEQDPEGAEKQQSGDKVNAPDDQKETDIENKKETEVNTDNITINTQSSIKIKGPKTVYSDPYKRNRAANDADVVFLTHAHYDHYDEPSLMNVVNKDTVVVCPASMLADVKGLNLGVKEVIGMKAWETEEVAGGITAEAVPAYNLNKNYHPKANGWVGYIITMDGVRYYAAGDTDALPELEDVECDIAFVPVGGTFTMTATEAAGLVNKIRPAYAIPIHYGTIVGRAADADTFKDALDEDIKVVKKVEDAR